MILAKRNKLAGCSDAVCKGSHKKKFLMVLPLRGGGQGIAIKKTITIFSNKYCYFKPKLGEEKNGQKPFPAI